MAKNNAENIIGAIAIFINDLFLTGIKTKIKHKNIAPNPIRFTAIPLWPAYQTTARYRNAVKPSKKPLMTISRNITSNHSCFLLVSIISVHT